MSEEQSKKLEEMTVRVRLETKGGEFVHEGRMLRYNVNPDVLMWGLRVFVPMRPGSPADAVVTVNNALLYREAFATAMVMGLDGQPESLPTPALSGHVGAAKSDVEG
jgi:hypothetical protein